MFRSILRVACFFAASAPTLAQSIAEIRIAQSGVDTEEYFELQGEPSASLQGLTYLVLGDPGSGVVEYAQDLTGFSLSTNGRILVGNAEMIIATPDLVSAMVFDNEVNVTHMLVLGFTGQLGADLDTDDDGVLDTTPWNSVVDSVAIVADASGGAHTYSPVRVGPNGAESPQHVWTCAGSWLVSDGDVFAGWDTPGSANFCEPNLFCESATPNSGGSVAQISGVLNSIMGSGLHLDVSGGPPGEIGYFLVGSGLSSATPLMIGQGQMCLAIGAGHSILRYNLPGDERNSMGQFDGTGRFQNLAGTALLGYGFDVPSRLPNRFDSPLVIGATWHFQLWYRDGAAGAGQSNLSDGLSITF